MAINFLNILNYQIGNNYGRDYLMALISFVIFIIALLIFKGIIVHKLKILTKKTKSKFDDLVINYIKSH